MLCESHGFSDSNVPGPLDKIDRRTTTKCKTPNNPERIPTIALRKKISNMFTDTSAIGRYNSI